VLFFLRRLFLLFLFLFRLVPVSCSARWLIPAVLSCCSGGSDCSDWSGYAGYSVCSSCAVVLAVPVVLVVLVSSSSSRSDRSGCSSCSVFFGFSRFGCSGCSGCFCSVVFGSALVVMLSLVRMREGARFESSLSLSLSSVGYHTCVKVHHN
jgi:hypothetical protein